MLKAHKLKHSTISQSNFFMIMPKAFPVMPWTTLNDLPVSNTHLSMASRNLNIPNVAVQNNLAIYFYLACVFSVFKFVFNKPLKKPYEEKFDYGTVVTKLLDNVSAFFSKVKDNVLNKLQIIFKTKNPEITNSNDKFKLEEISLNTSLAVNFSQASDEYDGALYINHSSLETSSNNDILEEKNEVIDIEKQVSTNIDDLENSQFQSEIPEELSSDGISCIGHLIVKSTIDEASGSET